MAESMQGLKRTHRCGELSSANIGEKVTVMGWVQKNRNKGGIVFMDLRDRSGILQIVFEGEEQAELMEKASKLRSEFVVAVVGNVEKRSGAVNENLATGEIEVRAEELRILSESEVPPFQVEENSKTKEELRLKYRYLDLRRPDLQRNLRMRSQVTTLARQFFAEEGFLEIETPILGKTTPEGARDYLVPSRVHPGSFYGLPQSPQLYKQLLMCSGCDRYIQIAKCFRDEDLRADRQPEFTQIDMELSFVDVDDVIEVNERFLAKLFKEVLDVDVQLPIQRMTWQEAMDRYGSDKPDTRFGMELVNVTETVKDSEFVVFKGACLYCNSGRWNREILFLQIYDRRRDEQSDCSNERRSRRFTALCGRQEQSCMGCSWKFTSGTGKTDGTSGQESVQFPVGYRIPAA